MRLENGGNEGSGVSVGKLLNSQTFLFDTDLQASGGLLEEDGGKIMSGNDMAKSTWQNQQSFFHRVT